MSTELRVKIARDLRAVEELWGNLIEEAMFRSSDKEFPGGNALTYAAPAGNLEAWQNRYETAERVAAEAQVEFASKFGGRDYAGDQEAELHPLLVLGTWEDIVRDERDQPTDLRATVARAADYLRNSLDWMFALAADEQMRFARADKMSVEIHRCRAMLENLLMDGERAEFARVTCTEPNCDEKPRLMKVYGEEAATDHHKCPACRARYDFDEFVRAAKVHAFSEAADKTWMTIADAAFSIERPVNTIRTWIKNDRIQSRRTPGVPTTVYVFWPDVRDVHRDSRVVEARRKSIA